MKQLQLFDPVPGILAAARSLHSCDQGPEARGVLVLAIADDTPGQWSAFVIGREKFHARMHKSRSGLPHYSLAEYRVGGFSGQPAAPGTGYILGPPAVLDGVETFGLQPITLE